MLKGGKNHTLARERWRCAAGFESVVVTSSKVGDTDTIDLTSAYLGVSPKQSFESVHKVTQRTLRQKRQIP